MVTERNQQLDGIKYLLICLVVLCHLMQGVRYANLMFQSFYSVVYSFHMPLFVLLSGFFFHKNDAKEIHQSNLRLLEPLIIYHLLFVHSSNWKSYLFFEPSPLWYLLSLICWKWIIFGIEKTMSVFRKDGFDPQNSQRVNQEKRDCIFIVTISIILSVVAMFFIKERYSCLLSIMRTFQFFPFFAIGHVLTQDSIIKLQSRKSITMLTIMSLFTVIILCFFSGPELNAILFSKYNIYSLSTIVGHDLFSTFGLKCAVMIASIILCFAVLSINKYPRWLSTNGGSTLFILCTHAPIYYFAQGINNGYLAFFVAIVSIVSLTILSKTKIAPWLLYPISKLKICFINKNYAKR